ncbi:MAG: hypothetical protein WAK67_13960, partial [Xanthobacteraceae bacterium]
AMTMRLLVNSEFRLGAGNRHGRARRAPKIICASLSHWPSKCCADHLPSQSEGDHPMPLAKIHIVEGAYDETRIAKVSGALAELVRDVG